MSKLALAERIDAGEGELAIFLARREIRTPWERCSARLAAAPAEQRGNAELSPGSCGIHWPMIDEDLPVSGLLRETGNER